MKVPFLADMALFELHLQSQVPVSECRWPVLFVVDEFSQDEIDFIFCLEEMGAVRYYEDTGEWVGVPERA